MRWLTRPTNFVRRIGSVTVVTSWKIRNDCRGCPKTMHFFGWHRRLNPLFAVVETVQNFLRFIHWGDVCQWRWWWLKMLSCLAMHRGSIWSLLDHPSLHSFQSHRWQRSFDRLHHFRSTVELPPRVSFSRDWAHPSQRLAVGCHEIYPFENRLLLHQNRSEWDCPRNCSARERVRCWRTERIVFPIGSICVRNPHEHQRTWWL